MKEPYKSMFKKNSKTKKTMKFIEYKNIKLEWLPSKYKTEGYNLYGFLSNILHSYENMMLYGDDEIKQYVKSVKNFILKNCDIKVVLSDGPVFKLNNFLTQGKNNGSLGERYRSRE